MRFEFAKTKVSLMVFVGIWACISTSTWAQEAPTTTPDHPGIWSDIIYGDATASVELIEYGSLSCPACGGFAAQVFPLLKKDFMDKGTVKFVFRNYVRDRYDLAAAAGARCLNDEEATKRAIANIFAEQPTWMRSPNPYEAIAEIMAKEGMSQTDFGQCLSQQSVRNYLVDMTQNGAQKYEIKSVPSLILDGKLMSFDSYEDLKGQIEAAVAAKQLAN